jgi:hypothetical protein
MNAMKCLFSSQDLAAFSPLVSLRSWLFALFAAIGLATDAAATTPTVASAATLVSADVLTPKTLSCRFTSREGRPVANQRVEVRRDGWLLSTQLTDGNGFVAWTTHSGYGPALFTFTLRGSSRWASSTGRTTLHGVLPVNMFVQIVAETPVQNGSFQARVEIRYSAATIGNAWSDVLKHQRCGVTITHAPSRSAVSMRLSTGSSGTLLARVQLPAAMMQALVDVQAELPGPPRGYFRDVGARNYTRPAYVTR